MIYSLSVLLVLTTPAPCMGREIMEARKSIIFHRPYPIVKLGKIQLLCMGKRLTKHFGWVRVSSVCEK
jgi:hypothetical protein